MESRALQQDICGEMQPPDHRLQPETFVQGCSNVRGQLKTDGRVEPLLLEASFLTLFRVHRDGLTSKHDGSARPQTVDASRPEFDAHV